VPATGGLPCGVALRPLVAHADPRGVLYEIFRAEWSAHARPVQWNFVRSAAGVLRGVHLHPRHWDYLVVLDGCMTLGLADLRSGSPTEGLASIVTLDAAELRAALIPPGVAHGFYFDVPSLHVYGVDCYWNPADELGCRFDDPGLGLRWPIAPKLLSERDRALPPLAELRPHVPPYTAAAASAGGERAPA